MSEAQPPRSGSRGSGRSLRDGTFPPASASAWPEPSSRKPDIDAGELPPFPLRWAAPNFPLYTGPGVLRLDGFRAGTGMPPSRARRVRAKPAGWPTGKSATAGLLHRPQSGSKRRRSGARRGRASRGAACRKFASQARRSRPWACIGRLLPFIPLRTRSPTRALDISRTAPPGSMDITKWSRRAATAAAARRWWEPQ